ncbi:MAG: nicotinate phosphoribosyltransferase, partial [Eubacteriales bacterium]|nr:nicotinate phosphoribosyltransferase [Eubacteriales bacterium]
CSSDLAIEEGTVVFPFEPLVTVRAPIFQAQLLESALLNIINFQTLIATKASRVVRAAKPASVIEFGLRRAQAPDASIYGARAAVIGGCDSTSNVLACQMFDQVPKGTHAHSWIMSFDSELKAFREYARIFPHVCLLLVDTYDTLKSGIPNAITVFNELRAKGIEPVGIRLDSGDLAYLSKKAREMLDEAGFPNTKIFASGDLDETTIQSLILQGSRIDMYGVGTYLITSHNNPSLGGVYKLCAIEENGKLQPKMKVSDNPFKITNPGEKRVYRLFENKTNKAIADVICLEHEVIDSSKPYTLIHPTDRWKKLLVEDFYVKPLMTQIFKNGELIYKLPPIDKIVEKANASKASFWDEYMRLTKPQTYKVDLSEELFELKHRMLMNYGKD